MNIYYKNKYLKNNKYYVDLKYLQIKGGAVTDGIYLK